MGWGEILNEGNQKRGINKINRLSVVKILQGVIQLIKYLLARMLIIKN